MPSEPREIAEPKLLIGEGVDEVRFFQALLTHLGIARVQVEDCGGKSKLADYLETLPTRPFFRTKLLSLGVTRDADGKEADALRSVQDALTKAGLPAPPDSGCLVGEGLRVGVFILPGGGRPGMLEDLCLEAVHADPVLPCLDEYFACIVRQGYPLPANIAKARVHAWLASRAVPDRRLGEAAKAGEWPWDDPAFEPLQQFLRSL
jgi:hypothetical protein